jgi:hypothetical protein
MLNRLHQPTNRLWYILLGGALVSTGVRMAQAQAVDSNTVAAQAVGTAFLNAVRAGDWRAAAAFLDVVPLDHFRLEQIDAARRSRMRPGITVEQLMMSDSAMPRAVAEYEVRRMREHGQNFSFLEYQFGITDPDSLAAMPASVAAEHWLEVRDPRWRMKNAYKQSNCPLALVDSLPKPNFRVLGTVVNDATAYLLYERDDDPPMDVNQVRPGGPRMLTLRRGIDQWWVLPRESTNSGAVGVTCSVGPKRK